MVLQFMLEGPQLYTILYFNHTTAEYLNRNVPIGQLLQHVLKSVVVSPRSRRKNASKKHMIKKLAWLHNHCLLLAMAERAQDFPF